MTPSLQMKNTSKASPQNPNSLKKKLASRFLMAMKKLRKISPSPLMAEKGRRSNAIRAAAYASMASTVGPRRAWSRALLKKIRNRKPIIRGRKRRVVRRNPRNGTRFGYEGLKDLSEIVPGGKEMGSCRLLNETGHYIKCLTAQVQIMREILDSYSSRL